MDAFNNPKRALAGSALTLLLILFFSHPVCPGPLKNSVLTIDEVIHLALTDNFDINMAKASDKKARAALEKSKSAFMPTLSLFSEISAGDAPSAYLFKTIDQRELPQTVNFNNPGSFSNLETGIMAGINLYNGGRTTLSTGMARLDITDKAQMVKQTENQIVSAVIRLYFFVLKAEEYMDISKKSLTAVQEQLKVTTIRYKGGGVLKSDILSLKVRLAEAKKSLVTSNNLYANTVAALLVLLGREPEEELQLKKECECPVTFPENHQEALETALEKRAEMVRATAIVDKAAMALKMAGAGYLPKVDLTGKVYMDSENPAFNASTGNYVAALLLNWDLFTGFSTRAEVKQARLELVKAVENKKKNKVGNPSGC